MGVVEGEVGPEGQAGERGGRSAAVPRDADHGAGMVIVGGDVDGDAAALAAVFTLPAIVPFRLPLQHRRVSATRRPASLVLTPGRTRTPRFPWVSGAGVLGAGALGSKRVASAGASVLSR